MKVLYIVGVFMIVITCVFLRTNYWAIEAMENSGTGMQWGAYVGDGDNDLNDFEKLVGKKVDILADFESWEADFPLHFKTTVGQKGKTLVIFWEPSFGYDTIISGLKDSYIRQFATDAKSYGYPIVLAPFDEMNLDAEAWGYGQNENTAQKFIAAWKRIHGIFANTGATNVKFAITYNNISLPNIIGNRFVDYYPGDAYVDYVAVDGFNFGNEWQSFAEVFDSTTMQLSVFNKPMYILSTGSVHGDQKAAWITDMGERIKTYPKLLGWVWFNSNSDKNWLVNTDETSLAAFRSIIPSKSGI